MEQQAGILKINIFDLPIRSYAHIGDAVYELYVREKTVCLTSKAEKLHKITVSLVNAEFQAYLLDNLSGFLNEPEQEFIRRARNIPVTTARRTNQKIHRLSTAFEALIGYLYLTNRERLKDLFIYIDPLIANKLTDLS